MAKQDEILPNPIGRLDRLHREDMTLEQIQEKEADRLIKQKELNASHIAKIAQRSADATDPTEKARLEALLAYHNGRKVELDNTDVAVLASQRFAEIAERKLVRESKIAEIQQARKDKMLNIQMN